MRAEKYRGQEDIRTENVDEQKCSAGQSRVPCSTTTADGYVEFANTKLEPDPPGLRKDLQYILWRLSTLCCSSGKHVRQWRLYRAIEGRCWVQGLLMGRYWRKRFLSIQMCSSFAKECPLLYFGAYQKKHVQTIVIQLAYCTTPDGEEMRLALST